MVEGIKAGMQSRLWLPRTSPSTYEALQKLALKPAVK